MEYLWRRELVPKMVRQCAHPKLTAHAHMPVHCACHHCGRTDVDGFLDLAALNEDHYWQCYDSHQGQLVGSVLLQCPSGQHVVCVDCVRNNWWRNKMYPGSLCAAPACGSWTASQLALAGVPLSQLCHFLRTPCKQEGVCPDSGEPWDGEGCGYCSFCAFMAKHGLLRGRCSAGSRPPPTPLPVPRRAAGLSLTAMCRNQLSTQEMCQVQQHLLATPCKIQIQSK